MRKLIMFEVDEKLLKDNGLDFRNELKWLADSGINVVKECDAQYFENISTLDIFHIAKEYKDDHDSMEFLTNGDTWSTFDDIGGTEICFFGSRAECVDYARAIELNSYYVYTLEDYKR